MILTYKRGAMLKKISTLVVLLSLTILLINDYFPSQFFAFSFPTWLLILVFILLFAINNFMVDKETVVQKLKRELFMVLYIASLLVLFTLLGGKSVSNFSFDNFIVWFVFIFSILRIAFDWKMETRNKVSND